MCNVHRHNYWLIKYNTKHSRYTDTISTHLQRYASMQHQLTCLGFLCCIWHSLSSHDAVNFEGVYYYIIMNQIAFLLHQFYSILFYILIVGRRVALKSSPWVLPELLNPGFFLLLYELNRPAPLILACWPSRGLNCPPALPCSPLKIPFSISSIFWIFKNEISLILGGDIEAACRTDCLIFVCNYKGVYSKIFTSNATLPKFLSF